MTTALACVTASAATNYDLLAASSVVNVAYQAEFDESAYNYNRGDDGLPALSYILYQTYYNDNCGSLYRTNRAWYYFGWSQNDHTPVDYNMPNAPYSVNSVKTATDYDVSFSRINSDKLTLVRIPATPEFYLQMHNLSGI